MRKDGEDMELALDPPARLHAVAPAENAPPAEDTDAELIVRVAGRDRDAFGLLYRRYVRSVFGLALRRLRDRQRAEDAVQETFAAVWRSAASYPPERGPAAPWLYAIARNAIVDRFRTQVDTTGEVPEIVSGDPGPSDAAETSFVSWRVHRTPTLFPPLTLEVV